MKRGAPKIRIREEYGTPEFDAAYQAAVSNAPTRKTPEIKAAHDTLEWGWLLYKQSGAWQSAISESTRRQRENIMKHVLKKVTNRSRKSTAPPSQTALTVAPRRRRRRRTSSRP